MYRLTVVYDEPADKEAFDRRYTDEHVPLVKASPGLVSFQLSHPQGGTPYLFKGPPWLNPDVDMHATGTASLWPSPKADLLKQCMNFESDPTNVFPSNAWTGIEIDSQLIGMVEIVCPNGVGMQLNAAEVRHPDQTGSMIDHQFFGSSSRGKRKRHRLHP